MLKRFFKEHPLEFIGGNSHLVGGVFRLERGSDHTGTQGRKLRASFSVEADVGSQSVAARAQVSAESVGMDQKTLAQLERETGIEPATFSLGS
jgi:hypothetical protein